MSGEEQTPSGLPVGRVAQIVSLRPGWSAVTSCIQTAKILARKLDMPILLTTLEMSKEEIERRCESAFFRVPAVRSIVNAPVAGAAVKYDLSNLNLESEYQLAARQIYAGLGLTEEQLKGESGQVEDIDLPWE